MSRPYRFGIIGAGMIAPFHLEAIRTLPNAEPAGIMDHGSGTGRGLAPELDHTGAGDLDAFLARDDIDIVTVATPSGTHLEAGLKAARAGKHCIIEKPMEVTVARIDELIAAHEAAGTLLGGIFNSRFTRAAAILERAIRAGRFGRLTFASAVGPWWRDQSYYGDSQWKGTWALDGGGALMNQGIHSIDMLQWLVGAEVSGVSGRVSTLAHPGVEVEDTASASIVFDNGVLGTIACTTSMWPGHFRTITIGGDAGTAVLADDRFLVWRFRDTLPEDDSIRDELVGMPGDGVGASDPAAGVTADGHRAVFGEFLKALESGRAPAIDGRESRKAVAIIRAIYRSSECGGAPVVPE